MYLKNIYVIYNKTNDKATLVTTTTELAIALVAFASITMLTIARASTTITSTKVTLTVAKDNTKTASYRATISIKEVVQQLQKLRNSQ